MIAQNCFTLHEFHIDIVFPTEIFMGLKSLRETLNAAREVVNTIC
jgi:hypothetical protein